MDPVDPGRVESIGFATMFDEPLSPNPWVAEAMADGWAIDTMFVDTDWIGLLDEAFRQAGTVPGLVGLRPRIVGGESAGWLLSLLNEIRWYSRQPDTYEPVEVFPPRQAVIDAVVFAAVVAVQAPETPRPYITSCWRGIDIGWTQPRGWPGCEIEVGFARLEAGEPVDDVAAVLYELADRTSVEIEPVVPWRVPG